MESIMKGDMLKSRRYRNRYLGDFLKELDLTEGRSTGVPTIQEKLADNGSPRATFETTEDRLTFLIHIPIHPSCKNNPLSVGHIGQPNSSSEKTPDGSEKSSETKEKSSERKKKSSERILDLIKNKPTISAAEIAMEIGMSTRGVEKQIRKLRESGIIKRIGADFGGYWEINRQSCQQLSAQIAETDQEIDLKGYHLYGMTFDEVLIADPNAPIKREEFEK